MLECESYVHSCDVDKDGDVVVSGEFAGHVKVNSK